ncbi:MAG: biotin--[acetyl-CoA-carboxylase] ligase, partial [Desulfobacula sp.]|nr:biotin--[acetyl-CoA-carboxylase] ligase [Desulfobacula sp.]
GINVNNNPGAYEPKAIALKDVLNKSISRRLILETFLDDFETSIKNIDCKTTIEQWKEMTSTIGSKVRIETIKEVFEGSAIDVDESGALIIEDGNGKKQKIIYGDCFHIGEKNE